MLNIELLGGFRIARDGKPAEGTFTARLQALIAYLTLRAGVPVSRQQLAFLFWADSREAQARTNLRQLLHHLRSALPEVEGFLESDSQDVCWNTSAGWCLDAALFEQAASQIDNHPELERAARIYKGDLLPVIYEDWIEPHRSRLKSTHEATLERLAMLSTDANNFSAAVGYAEQLLSGDPLREASYQLLMRIHARRGDRAGAIAVYERCRQTLTRELAVAPGDATERVREEIFELRPARPATPKVAVVSAAHGSLLVGRSHEWEALVSAWTEAAGGSTIFVTLTGEAGIGKTRLLEELRAYVMEKGASAATAGCYSSSQALAYSAVADWLRAAPIRPFIPKLAAPDRAQLARVLPEILAEQPDIAPPPPFTESWQRRHFFEAIACAVLRAKAPLLLAIDDLQWCDSETLEWILYLVRSQPTARLLIVATARMEELRADHAVTAAVRELVRTANAREIPVAALDEEDTLKLGAQVSSGKLAADGITDLYLRTRGNPLFICETIRAGEHAPKVQAVIGTRLARLDNCSRQLVEAAAVIGRPFSLEIASALAGLTDADSIQAADDLWRHKVLRIDDAERYEFTHGCVRDAAYSAIGPARRKQLHRLTAEAMEAASEHDGARRDEAAAQIAAHYEQAGEARRAIPWYQRAAALVRRRYAEDEAIALLTKALTLLERQPESPERDRTELDLLLSLGPSLSALRGFAAEDAGKSYARARLLCEVMGETDRYITVLGGSWTFHVVRAELEIAREIASRYAGLAERTDDNLHKAAGSFCMGSTEYFRGALHDSRKHLERTAALDSLSPQRYFALGPELGIFSGGHMTHLLWLLGEPDLAEAEIARLLERAHGLSHPFSSALALAYAASLHQFRDEPDATEDRAQAAATLCRKHGFNYYLSWTPILIGWARTRNGDLAGGLNQMIQGFDALRATGAGLRAPYYLGLIAQAAGRNGDTQAGLAYLRQALDLGERSRENWVRPELQRIEGDLLLQAGNTREASTSYQNGLRAARQIGSKAWEARVRTSLENISS